MLQGFETSNRRFEEMRTDMNKRFEQVDKPFEQIDNHFTNRMDRFMFWSLGLTISAVIVIVIIKLT